MQFLVIFLVYALAVGNAEECSEDRAEACVESLLASILEDSTEEDVCKELKTSITCLRSAVEECISQEEADPEVEEGLQELEKVLKDNCQAGGEEEEDTSEMQKCFDENEDELYDCLYESTTKILSVMIESEENLDEKAFQCTLYAMMSSCFIERIGEKCGQRAAELTEEDLADMPPEIEQACNAAGDIQVHSFQLLDKRRK